MLEPNSPVTEEQLRELQGLPVCIVMNDGTHHFGLITGCSKGKVVLNGDVDDSASIPSAPRAGRKTGKGRKGRRSGHRLVKAAGRRTKTGGGATAAEEPSSEEVGGWGYFGLGPPVSPFGPKVELPIKPIDAVLLL